MVLHYFRAAAWQMVAGRIRPSCSGILTLIRSFEDEGTINAPSGQERNYIIHTRQRDPMTGFDQREKYFNLINSIR